MVRQRSAKPLSPVQVRVPPPQNVITFSSTGNSNNSSLIIQSSGFTDILFTKEKISNCILIDLKKRFTGFNLKLFVLNKTLLLSIKIILEKKLSFAFNYNIYKIFH